MFVYLALILLFLYVVDLFFKNTPTARLVRKIPFVKERFIIGHGTTLFMSPVELFKKAREWAVTFDGIYGWWCPFISVANICTPQDIETVIAGSKNVDKSLAYVIVKDWLHEGLLVSSGAKWHHRRKILTPAFHFNILKRFFITIEENSHNLIESLEKMNGEQFDIIPVISNYTLNAICETAMGTRLHVAAQSSGKIYKESIYKLGQLFIERLSHVFLANDFLFRFTNLATETYKQLDIVKTFTKNVIKERKEYVEEHGIKFPDENEKDDDLFLSSKKKRIAMLDLLISAQKENVIDDDGIQEEVDTFMFEGHDTTAAGLTYCLMLLANHKEIQDKIVSELKDIFGDSDRHATYEDLSLMKYLECCVKESLRLYPPVPFIGRQLDERVVLSGYTVNPGSYCHIHIYDLHRREDLYKNALKFDPDRFLPENSVGRHPFAYIPFSAGPRNCIGQRFAMMEMKSCVAAILRRFELQPVTKPDDIEFTCDLVLRSTKPVYVKFIRRRN